MKTLKIEKESRQVYDIEMIAKPSLLLKGIGVYCIVCGKHIFPRQKNQATCSQKCRAKKSYLKNKNDAIKEGLHAFISLKKYKTLKPYRIIKIYLKKGIKEEVKITPESKELWKLIDKIERFRDLKQPIRESIKC